MEPLQICARQCSVCKSYSFSVAGWYLNAIRCMEKIHHIMRIVPWLQDVYIRRTKVLIPHHINKITLPSHPSSAVPWFRIPLAETGVVVGYTYTSPVGCLGMLHPVSSPPRPLVNVTIVVTGSRVCVVLWMTTAVPLCSRLSVVPLTVTGFPPGMSVVPWPIAM